MGMYLDRVGARSVPAPRSWRPRDCSLYALAVGAGFDDLAFATDGLAGVEQQVYPTFVLAGVMAAEAESWPDPCFATGDFPLERVVHGQQALVLHRPIEPAGDVMTTTAVAGIYDKGSGALVVLETEALDTTDGEPVFTATTSLFVTGEGGFGGAQGPSGPLSGKQGPSGPLSGKQGAAEPAAAAPERQPDHRVTHPTLPIQTLLYRHAGNDHNPVHLDPSFASEAGFPEPILMGLNTLGSACRALVHTVAGSEPARLRSIEGRFAAPGYNGDVLTTDIWAEGDTALFRVVNQRGEALLDRGRARFSPQSC